MTAGGSGAAPKYLQDLFRVGTVGGLTDGELLERFARRGGTSEAAFAALVERHGPMVLRVCRTLVGDVHEAQDAFQATFLVLARRADSIRNPGLLANWLYGVAHRTARKAKARALRRRSHEGREDPMSALEAVDPEEGHDLALVHREQAGLIHEELERLPEKHRAVVVLCCLEELTIEAAAQRLRCTPGAVRGRLAEARGRLRNRLTRRGVAVPAAVVAATLSAQTASAAVAPALRDATASAAMGTVGGASAGIVALADSVSRVMFFSALKVPAAVLLSLAVVGAGVGVLTHEPRQQQPVKRPVKATAAASGGPADQRKLVEGLDWFVSVVDPDRGLITLEHPRGQFGGQGMIIARSEGRSVPAGLTLVGLNVAPDARITIDGRASDLKQLRARAGMGVVVKLAADRFAVTSLRAESPISPAPPQISALEGVDVAERAVTVALGDGSLRLEKIRVAEGAKITLLDVSPIEGVGLGRPELKDLRLVEGTKPTPLDAPPDESARLGRLEFKDLRPGMPVSPVLEMGADGRLFVRSLKCARSKTHEERSR